MEFGKISSMNVGEVLKGTATEGGAVIAGLLGAGILGKQVEKFVKVATPTSTMLDKALAYAGNNVPKIAAYYLVRKEGGKLIGADLAKDVGKGILGSVVLDTLIRSGNSFAPGTTFKLFGYDVMSESAANDATPQMQQNMQKVIQENSSLRQQLNGVLQKLASSSQTAYIPPSDHVSYGNMPGVAKQNPTYGNMDVNNTPSQKRYGQMTQTDMSLNGDMVSLGTRYGMD